MAARKGILERLAEGPVIGDGSMTLTLEKRGYCKAGPWTPEATVEYPEAVLQLHREFVRAGADVVQTYAFYSSDDKLSYGSDKPAVHTSAELNDAACKLARKAADENGCLVAACCCPTPSFARGESEELVKAEFVKQVRVFQNHDIDFVIAEFFHDIRELEWCADEIKRLNKPIALNMRIGVTGDATGLSVEECAVRMAKTGAQIIGINCAYDMNTALKVMRRMKNALEKEDLHPHLMCQPLGMLVPEVEQTNVGRNAIPECPLGMDSRVVTRIEVHQYARAAWEIGVRYIGGCCGFEPYHIRAIAQELAHERGKSPPSQDMMDPFGGEQFKRSCTIDLSGRSTKEYWYRVKPGTGRPLHSSLSVIDNAGFEVRS